MASKRFDALTTQGLQRVRIGGSFKPNGTQQPDGVIGNGFSVSRTGVGSYQIAFEDNFFALDEAEATVRRANGTQALATLGAWDPSARTLDLYVSAEGAGVSQAACIPLDILSARVLSGGNFQADASLGGILTSDSAGGATILTAAGADTKIVLAAGITPTLAWSIPYPVGALAESTMQLSAYGRFSGEVDIGGVVFGVYFGTSVIDNGGVTPIFTSTYDKKSHTFTGPTSVYDAIHVTMTPQAHATDSLWISAVELTYFVLDEESMVSSDLPSDTDNVVNFSAIFRNTGVDY